MGADFVWHTEDVPDPYEQDYDPPRPVLCSDETPYQMIGARLMPLPMSEGKPGRYDYEYERNGVVSLFMVFQPGAGWRHVYVMSRRRKEEFARVMKYLADGQFPDAEEPGLVTDNPNTHTPASPDEVFSPEEARRLTLEPDIHHYSRTCELAGYGGNRNISYEAAVPGSENPDRGNAESGNSGLGRCEKRSAGYSQMAIY